MHWIITDTRVVGVLLVNGFTCSYQKTEYFTDEQSEEHGLSWYETTFFAEPGKRYRLADRSILETSPVELKLIWCPPLPRVYDLDDLLIPYDILP